MKNIAKIVMLFCLIACMLLSVVSCNAPVKPVETTPVIETTDITTPEGTTPEVTTPEVTTPEATTPEATTPEGTTPEPEQPPVDPNKDKVLYQIKVVDNEGAPIIGVELQMYIGETYIKLPATGLSGCALSEYLAPAQYAVRVLRADGYDFDFYHNYYFEQDAQTMEIVLERVVEKIDMNGYIYKAYVRDYAGTSPDALKAQLMNGNNAYRCIDFWVDEANSENDAISYAVYNRNQQIQNDYNCKIRQVSSDGSQIEHLTAAYVNGDGYDLTIILAKAAAHAATQGLLRNLKDSQYMDLSNPAFDQNSVKDLSVKNKLYFLSGDMNISPMEVAGVTVVNMDFYENLVDTIVEDKFDGNELYNNIYDVVSAKKWTMDTMLKMAQTANIDIDPTDGEALHVLPNGFVSGEEVDNKYKGGDTVGYHQYLYSGLWYFYGSGGRITAKNEDGLPELVFAEKKAETLYDAIYAKFNRVHNATWIPHENADILSRNFLTGDVLFADMSLFNIRNEIYPKVFEFEYGILPIPTYQEGMDYQSVVHFNNWVHLWAIPTLCNNVEYAERMMEIMAVYSGMPDSTMSAYYDRTVYLLASANNGSRKVLDTIRTSLVYDMALLYPSWGGIEERLYQIPNREESEYASIISWLGYLEYAIEGTVDELMNPSAAN